MLRPATSNVVVDVGDLKVSNDPAVTLVTYSLGSCVGVAAYDPLTKVAGLLHCQLPSASINVEKGRAQPGMFADTGMAALLGSMSSLGADRKRLKVKIAGAAQMLNDAGVFDIGRRNHAAIRKLLWQAGLLVEAEQCGGSEPRTVYLRVSDGDVQIRTTAKRTAL